MSEVNTGKGAHPALGACRQLAVLVEPPELTTSLVLRLPRSDLDDAEKFWRTTERGAAVPADTTVFLFLLLKVRAVLSSLDVPGKATS